MPLVSDVVMSGEVIFSSASRDIVMRLLDVDRSWIEVWDPLEEMSFRDNLEEDLSVWSRTVKPLNRNP